MNLQELKDKSPADLISEAEKLGIENPKARLENKKYYLQY